MKQIRQRGGLVQQVGNGPLQADRDETVDGHDMLDPNLTQVTRTA